MDRLAFYNCISGVDYPEMIVTYFDQFAALHSIVQDFKTVCVEGTSEKSISFVIEFSNARSRNAVMSCPESIIIYGRPLAIIKESISDNIIKLTIQ